VFVFHAIATTPGTSRDADATGYPCWASDTCGAIVVLGPHSPIVAAAVGEPEPDRSIARAFSVPSASAIQATAIRSPTAAMFANPEKPVDSFRVVAPSAIGADHPVVPERSRNVTLPVSASTHTA
jgi:hypothetical protein